MVYNTAACFCTVVVNLFGSDVACWTSSITDRSVPRLRYVNPMSSICYVSRPFVVIDVRRRTKRVAIILFANILLSASSFLDVYIAIFLIKGFS